MKRNSTIKGLTGFMIILMLLLGIWSCKKNSLVYNTTGDVNMTGYLDKYPDKFSEWKKILDLTGNASFLNAYGGYTMFTPTNDAVKIYLKEKGVATSDKLDLNELKNIVRFHLLSDTIHSNTFTDGKLTTLTMYGQYLITGSQNVGGVSQTVINRQGVLLQSDVAVGNGIIHVIDHVLQPAKFTVAQLIENDPKYAIFTQALKETGLYDSLNILPANNPIYNQKFLTVLAESDSVFNVAGITSYADLLAKNNTPTTTDLKSALNGLHAFMAYHIIYDAKYLADIASTQSQKTLAPNEILTTQLVGTTILINDVTFMGVHEIGSPINRAKSDNSASNGVLNEVFVHFDIKVRKPSRIDWDITDFPEIRKMPGVWGKKGVSFSNAAGQPIAGWFLPGPSTVDYSPLNTYAYNSDWMAINLGTNRSPYVDMRTPLIVRGKYKMWIGYRKNQAVLINVSIDGVTLPKILDPSQYMQGAGGDASEAVGYKSYMVDSWNGRMVSRLVGTIDIKTTDVHTCRFTAIKGGQVNWFDLIQFIPVDQDQQYPQFYPNKTTKPRP